MITAKTEKELGEAIKNGETYIEIEGDLSKKVFRIKATGKVAWAVAVGALIVALASVVAPPAAPAALAFAAPAIAVLGMPAALAALLIAVAGGGIGTLNKLRDYKIKEADGKTILYK